MGGSVSFGKMQAQKSRRLAPAASTGSGFFFLPAVALVACWAVISCCFLLLVSSVSAGTDP
jgi:hypothetical protein